MDVLLDTGTGRRAVRCLLLLHLLVMKAAADCPPPQGGANTALTNEALLLNNFPDGLEVTLECGRAFVKESGSGIITCIDGRWTEPDLKCKKRDCGAPEPQPHMTFDIITDTLYGSVVKVICDRGFQVSGSSYITCYVNGWSGRGTTCEIVTCVKPGNVTNGRSSWDSQEYPKYGEIIDYLCNEGYILVGKDSLVCGVTGEYDYQPPTCEGQTTEDKITTKMPTSTPPAQEASTSTESPATPTPTATPTPRATPTPTPTPAARRDKFVTTSTTPTVSPSLPGGGGIWTAEGGATTTSATSMTSSSFQGEHDAAVDPYKDIGYMPVIVSVIGVLLVVCLAGIILYMFLLKRKGSVNGTAPIY